MKKRYLAILFVSLTFLSFSAPYYWTEFTMTVTITNNSDSFKEIRLERGRILELAKVKSDYYQSIIITGGDGTIRIPPHRTIEHQIYGICLNKGLKFPAKGTSIELTPFVGNAELVALGNDQALVHELTEFPRENIQLIDAKGYSDDKKDGREKDREEAFQNAVENAARESGFAFSSETLLENLNLIKSDQRITVSEKSIRLNRIIHEDYDEETGEYLYIGEFEVRSKPTKPEIK